MRRKYLVWSLPILGCALLLGAAAPTTSSSGAFATHIVTKGESVSLLCIERYGRYVPAMGPVIIQDNPEIKDINVIYPGQKINFRSPGQKSTNVSTAASTNKPAASSPAKPAAATALPVQSEPDVSLFEKRLDISQGVITCVEGEATLFTSGKTIGNALKANAIVVPGDVIATGKSGRVELIINRESVVRIRENSRVTLGAFRDLTSGKGASKVNFSIGSVWSKVKKFGDKVSRFQLEMPTAIAGVHGTVYQASCNADSSADVKVFDGEVAVSNNPTGSGGNAGDITEVAGPGEVEGPREVSEDEWLQLVQSMQQIHIAKNGKPGAPSSFTKSQNDSWEKWNTERDKRIAQMFGEK